MNALMRPNKKSNVLINLEASCKTMIRAKVGEIPDMSPNDGYLVIVNSEIMCGVFDKATVGDGKKTSVFAVIQRDYGADEAAKAMGRLAKVCARWLCMFCWRNFVRREIKADCPPLKPIAASLSASAT